MKTTYGWYNGSNGTNSSGFSGLPGGYRDLNGVFSRAGYGGYWWSSSLDGNAGIRWNLDDVIEPVYRNLYNKQAGHSVRCVREAE